MSTANTSTRKWRVEGYALTDVSVEAENAEQAEEIAMSIPQSGWDWLGKLHVEHVEEIEQ